MAGTSIYIPSGVDPATEAYSILVVYNDGSTQQLTPPPVSALEQCLEVLGKLWSNGFTFDKSTEIFRVNTASAGYRPSWNLIPLTSTDMTWFNANKDSNGIAWKAADYNGDGKMDLECWTADGRQIIYTV